MNRPASKRGVPAARSKDPNSNKDNRTINLQSAKRVLNSDITVDAD